MTTGGGNIWQTKIMKIKLCIWVVLFVAAMAWAQTNNLTTLLQQGLFEEQANRNLDAAIENYAVLARQFDKDRQIAATAVFRLGECYRAQGKTNEAAVQYQRILRDFADQKMLVTLSQQNLAGMGSAIETPATEARQQQKDLLTKQIALAEQDLADAKARVKTGQATEAEARAAEKEVLRLKQQLAGLETNKRVDLLDLSASAKSEEDQEIARIEKLIKDSPDLINKAEGGSDTLLSKAALKGQVKVVNYLLDHGAEVDAGFPALSQAARAGNRAMVELLLGRGANVNNPSEYGRTALTMAAEQGFIAVVEVLLAHKADPNAVDSRNGRTALYSTLMNGQDKCARRLIAAGAQVNTEALNGTTALSLVAERGWTEMAKTLLEAKADPNAGKKNQPLLAAIASKNLELVELLLKAGANPNAAGNVNFADAPVKADASFLNHKGNMTPLWFAVYQNQPEMVQLLLKYKADPDDTQTDRQPVIFKTLGNPEMLTALLDAGAQVEARDMTETFNGLNGPLASERTPLLKASQFIGGTNVVGLLLKYGANPNTVDTEGNTPLHRAAGDLAFEETFTLLLEHKANPNVRNQYGQTPLDLVKSAMTSPRWRFSQNSGVVTSEQKAFAEKIASLLRAHGALDKLPDWDRITVSRPEANFSQPVFTRGTNDWNHFTLLELLYAKYWNRSTELDFADLSHIVLARPSTSGAEIKRITVNLLNATNGLEVSRDIPLEFGDVVEIPERQHALSDRSGLLTGEEISVIQLYLQRHAGEARLAVAGSKAIQLKLPEFRALIKDILNQTEAQAVLTSSSDLSRVKVTRRDVRTGKTMEWIVDCAPEKPRGGLGLSGGAVSGGVGVPAATAGSFSSRLNRITSGAATASATDFWLRNGDVIEVPEKK
jgi:ankyrin repeat protein